MEKVGAREFRNRLSHYLKRVRSGEMVIVTDRGTPVAMLLPPPSEKDTDEALWRLVAQGRASWGGGKPKGATNPPVTRGKSVAQTVIDDRGPR